MLLAIVVILSFDCLFTLAVIIVSRETLKNR